MPKSRNKEISSVQVLYYNQSWEMYNHHIKRKSKENRPIFDIGHIVLKKNFKDAKMAELQIRYKNFYVIIKNYNNSSYLIKNLNNNKLEVANSINLKLYKGNLPKENLINNYKQTLNDLKINEHIRSENNIDSDDSLLSSANEISHQNLDSDESI